MKNILSESQFWTSIQQQYAEAKATHLKNQPSKYEFWKTKTPIPEELNQLEEALQKPDKDLFQIFNKVISCAKLVTEKSNGFYSKDPLEPAFYQPFRNIAKLIYKRICDYYSVERIFEMVNISYPELREYFDEIIKKDSANKIEAIEKSLGNKFVQMVQTNSAVEMLQKKLKEDIEDLKGLTTYIGDHLKSHEAGHTYDEEQEKDNLKSTLPLTKYLLEEQKLLQQRFGKFPSPLSELQKHYIQLEKNIFIHSPQYPNIQRNLTQLIWENFAEINQLYNATQTAEQKNYQSNKSQDAITTAKKYATEGIDFYKILNISSDENLTSETILRNYNEGFRHLNLNSNSQNVETQLEILNAARDIFLNPEAKNAYDNAFTESADTESKNSFMK